jgi:hypothetical protein
MAAKHSRRLMALTLSMPTVEIRGADCDRELADAHTPAVPCLIPISCTACR